MLVLSEYVCIEGVVNVVYFVINGIVVGLVIVNELFEMQLKV